MLSTPVQPKNTYDLLVIGGGSAGLTAAKFAATFGKVNKIIRSINKKYIIYYRILTFLFFFLIFLVSGNY